MKGTHGLTFGCEQEAWVAGDMEWDVLTGLDHDLELLKGGNSKDFMAITERMEVCVMRLVRGPYPSTAYGFRMEKGTWTASNCHQACAICFVVRSK